MKRINGLPRTLRSVACASALAAMALAFAPQAGATAMYEAKSTGTLKLLDVVNVTGSSIDTGWDVSFTRAVEDSYATAIDNASADAQVTFDPACTPGSPGSPGDCDIKVELAKGKGVTNTSKSEGQAGPPEGYAQSLMWTDINLFMGNTTTDQTLVFVFDWSATVGVTTGLDDPLLELVTAIASVTLHDWLDGGQLSFNKEYQALISSTGGGTSLAPTSQTCAPGGDPFDPAHLLCITVEPGKTAAVQMWVDTEGEAIRTIPVPIPSTLALLGLGLMAAAVRRRGARGA